MYIKSQKKHEIISFEHLEEILSKKNVFIERTKSDINTSNRNQNRSLI